MRMVDSDFDVFSIERLLFEQSLGKNLKIGFGFENDLCGCSEAFPQNEINAGMDVFRKVSSKVSGYSGV